MRIVTLSSPSIAELFNTIEQLELGNHRCLFRGQLNYSWRLVPSLYRIKTINSFGKSKKENFDDYESNLIDLFFSEGLPYLPKLDRNFYNDRILAQHYGVPTRLLDWTRDPLVATYFAVESGKEDCDAAIFSIFTNTLHLPDRKDLPPVDQLSQVVHLNPPAIDRRVPAQKSVFTYHFYGPSEGEFVPIDDREPANVETYCDGKYPLPAVSKIVIPAKLKLELLRKLMNIGVDRRNLFPGLEGVGMDVAARARIGNVWCKYI